MSTTRRARLVSGALALAAIAIDSGVGPRGAAARVRDPSLAPLATVIGGSVGPVAANEATVAVGVGARLVLLDASAGAVGVTGHTAPFTSTVTGVALAGDGLAVVAAGPAGLWTVDVSRPEVPVTRGRAPGPALAVAAGGDLAVALDGSAAVVYTIGDPASPRWVGRIASPAARLAVGDGVALLAEGVDGLAVIDLADPRAPREVARVTALDRVGDVALAGTRAYLADGRAGIRVLDVADPRAPVQLGALALEADCSQQPPGAPCPSASRIAVRGTLAVVGLERCDSAFSCRTPPDLRAIDTRNPALPRDLGGRETLGNPAQIAFAGRRPVVVTSGLWYYAGLAPCQFEPGSLLVLDENLAEVGAYAPPGGTDSLAAAGSRAWVVDGARNTLSAHDLSDPTRPREAGPSEWPVRYVGSRYGSAGPTDVRVSGSGEVWVAVGPRMGAASAWPAASVSSATGRQAPARPQNGCSPPPAGQWFLRLAVDGSGAPVVLDAVGTLRTLSREGRPVGELSGPEPFRELAAGGDRAYVVGGAQRAIREVDLADRTAPRLLGVIPGPAERLALDAERRLLFVAAGSTGLRVLSVSVPGAAVELAVVDTPGLAFDVALSAGDLFVADGPGGVLWFDVTDPRHPRERGWSGQIGLVRRLAVGDGVVVAAVSGEMVVLLAPGGTAVHRLLVPLAGR